MLYRIHFTIVFILSILVKSNFAISQNRNNIEFSVFETYNKQADYSTRYGNVSFANNLQLYGNDVGFTLNYKRLSFKKTFLKLGLGYENFEVNKIKNETKSGTSTNTNDRLINYPNNVLIQYLTSKYNYNNLLYRIGLEKQFSLSQKQTVVVGVDYLHANTISERYFIKAINTYYKTNHQGPFGDFLNVCIGLNKRLGNVSLIPSLVLPVYKSWRQDLVFKENPNQSIHNWFDGIGINLSVSYH